MTPPVELIPPVEHCHQHLSAGARATPAAGELVSAVHRDGTAHVVVHAHSGHLDPVARRELIDALLDAPDAMDSHRLEATVPLGDAEFLLELTARCDDVTVVAAGASALLNGHLLGRAVR